MDSGSAYAVVAYRCGADGEPFTRSIAVWSGNITADSSTPFTPPVGASTVEPGTVVDGASALRIDFTDAQQPDRTPLAFTGGSADDLLPIGLVLVMVGMVVLVARRRRLVAME